MTSTDAIESLARSMRFAEASDAAIASGQPLRAFELALECGDIERTRTAAFAIAKLPAPEPRQTYARRARAFAARRSYVMAEALIALAMGDIDEAAALFERAEAFTDAAHAHRSRGDDARAGRALEAHLRGNPSDVAARVALARILVDFDNANGAARVLQAIPEGVEITVEQREAIASLRAHVFASLGFEGQSEMAREAKPNHDEAKNGFRLFGRYEFVREIASSPSSRVIEAIDMLSNDRSRVALKVFTGAHVGAGRDALARFQREMTILASIESNAIVRPRELLAEGPTIVLPWLAGGSLADFPDFGAISPRRAQEITRRVLEALDAAHRRGIVHRDVKPANVLLDEAGGVFLSDFGVAHLDDIAATATVGLLGTLRYMSPEQRRGEAASPQSDLFSVGVVLAELLGVSSDAAARRGTLPDEIEGFLDKLCHKDPRSRPSSAKEAIDALDAIKASEWPVTRFALVSKAPAPSSQRSSLLPPREERFVATGPQSRHDAWLDRDEILVAEGDPRRAFARALASTTHALLPTLIGEDRATSSLRVEDVSGDAVVTLTIDEAASVREAVRRLHEPTRLRERDDMAETSSTRSDDVARSSPISVGRRACVVEASARALASTTHALLPTLIGEDRATSSLRVEDVSGDAVVTLTIDEAASVREAVRRLHEVGVAHGSIEASLRRTRDGLFLGAPSVEGARHASKPRDLDALASIERRYARA